MLPLEARATANTLRAEADTLLKRREYPAARAALETLLAQGPADLTVRLDLAHVMMKTGNYRASTATLVEGHDRELKAGVAAWITMARRLIFSGEIVAARRFIGRLEAALASNGPMHAAVAHLYWLIGDVANASKYINLACKLGVETPDELHLRAMLCHFQGQKEPAEEILQACLQRWPAFGAAAQALANLGTHSRERNHVALLKRQLERLPRDSREPGNAMIRAQFLAALSKELDDLDETENSWATLLESKSIMRSLRPYDAELESTFTGELLAAMSALPQEGTGSASTSIDPGAQPIFIVGMPRSGSTLLDRVLSSHPDVTSAGEINDFLRQLHWVADVPPSGLAGMRAVLRRIPHMDLAELGRRYLLQTRWRAGEKRYFVDKLPINIQLVPIIRRALPHAPILHIVRDPMDVCFSNFRAMFGDVTPWCNDLSAVAHFHSQYRRMVEHWHAMYPGAMLEVDYRALVENPESTIRSVLDFCDLSFDERCLRPESNAAPVATPSAAQVREPVHRRGLSSWRRYAAHLGPLHDSLHPTQKA